MTDTKDVINVSISRLMLSGNSRGYPASKTTTRPNLQRLFYRPSSSQRPRHSRRAPPSMSGDAKMHGCLAASSGRGLFVAWWRVPVTSCAGLEAVLLRPPLPETF
ncbi:unnamed protein product, partial [Ixodes pacificus]